MWLKPTCLLVSVIMHVGLALIGGQSFKPLSMDARPIMVDLVERPAPTPAAPTASAPTPRARKPAAPARRAPAPATTPRAEAQPKGEQDVVPLAAETEDRLPEEDGGAAGDSSFGDGEGTGWGAGRGGGRAGKAAANGLIKATPRIEFNATPDYPAIARENRWEGTARVRVRVTATGNVESVALERSSGHAMLDRSALDAVRQWRFIPATRNGVPVASEVSVQVPFPPKK
jgi:protein TonB